MPMVQKRPATIASTSPDGRGRLGARSPSQSHPNSKPQKTRASSALLNPTLDGALLPQIVPVHRALSPPPPPPQQQQNNRKPSSRPGDAPQARSPSKRSRASAVTSPAGVPRPAPQNARRAERADERTSAARAAAAAPTTTTSPAAVATPRRPSRSPTSKNKAGSSEGSRPAAPYRRKPTSQGASRSSANCAEDGESRADSVEAELTAEETMLLCGVQPGTTKALWFTSMLSQLDSRTLGANGSGSGPQMSEMDAASQRKRSDTQIFSVPQSSSNRAGQAPLTSATSAVSGPLQVPREVLLDAENTAGLAQLPAKRSGALPSLSAPRTHTPRSSSASATYFDGGDAAASSSHLGLGQGQHRLTQPVVSHRNDNSDEVSDGDTTEEEEEREEEFDSPSPTKFGLGTKRPLSEAADLLAQLRAAVAHRKSEEVPANPMEAHLRELRPTPQQLEECRVYVLSLESTVDNE